MALGEKSYAPLLRHGTSPSWQQLQLVAASLNEHTYSSKVPGGTEGMREFPDSDMTHRLDFVCFLGSNHRDRYKNWFLVAFHRDNLAKLGSASI